MADALALDLVGKGLVTDQLVLSVGYDRESLTRPELRGAYHGPVTTDPYGRPVPKAAHGSLRLGAHTASTRQLLRAAGELFDRIVDRRLLVRPDVSRRGARPAGAGRAAGGGILPAEPLFR